MKYVTHSIIIGLITTLYAADLLWMTMNAFALITFSAFGLYLGIALALNGSKKYYPPTHRNHFNATSNFFEEMMIARSENEPVTRTVTTTHNLDESLEELFDLIVDDFVMSWYKELGHDCDRVKKLLMNDLWTCVENVSHRLTEIDTVNFVTQEMLEAFTDHFKNIRMTNKTNKLSDEKFMLHGWLTDPKRELDLLRLFSEVNVACVLPSSYTACPPLAHFSREILATCVFKPTIDMLCAPDYINQKLYNWLDYREQLRYDHKRTYSAAATYEEYMKVIEECQDIEHLKQMRYTIISEIMQATSIQNLKRMKGVDVAKNHTPKGTSKGDLLRARNLTRYLNQLAVCKQFCEKRIYLLGGPDYKAYDSSTDDNIPGKMILSFSVIMQSSNARQHFFAYLMKHHKESLSQFWEAVSHLKKQPMREWHRMGSRLYQMYVAGVGSEVRLLLDRSTIRGMESFLRGNTGPDAFVSAQKTVLQHLEEKHYPSFIISDLYHNFITNFQWTDNDLVRSPAQSPATEEADFVRARKTTENDREKIEEHSTYAQEKLKELDDRIQNKSQALEAMQQAKKLDPKMTKLQSDISAEIDSLRSSRRQLDFHIERTELWVDHIGTWKATVYNADVVEEAKQRVVYFVIVISASISVTQGWVITRTLHDFRVLHRQLIQINSSLKNFKLPSKLKSGGEQILNKAKDVLQQYLTRILSMEDLSQSEVLYSFFSPSPEHLKQSSVAKSRGRFSLFSSGGNQDDSDSDDELLFADDDSSRDIGTKDSIAGPLYELIQEVCEVKGVFKWFRRTFIVFVKVTFGKSVNRQLYSFVEWLYCEAMLVYYLRLFRESYWPEEVATTSQPQQPQPQQHESQPHELHPQQHEPHPHEPQPQHEPHPQQFESHPQQHEPQPQQHEPEPDRRMRYFAKTKILDNMPDVVKNLVGDVNAKRGAIKAFEAFQDERLNKQLFYTLLQLYAKEIMPEINTLS